MGLVKLRNWTDPMIIKDIDRLRRAKRWAQHIGWDERAARIVSWRRGLSEEASS